MYHNKKRAKFSSYLNKNGMVHAYDEFHKKARKDIENIPDLHETWTLTRERFQSVTVINKDDCFRLHFHDFS